ncbi:MAG: HAMP domain-containing protein [Gammaproteobacteria bacterium]|nr:HAMP domain-containing protein [Gammaproteobacteria bacterium]
MAKGELATHVTLSTNDEINLMVNTFNAMRNSFSQLVKGETQIQVLQ